MVRLAPLLAVLAMLAGAAAPARAAPRWVELDGRGAAPPAREDAALAGASNGAVHLFGGQADGRVLADLWRLDVRRERWTRLRPSGRRPAARFGHNLVAERGGTLLLFGGQSGARFFSDVWRFDPRRARWRRLTARGPSARYGAAAALDPRSGALYVTHGFTLDGRFDDTWALRDELFADVSPPAGRPLERCLVQGAFHDGGLYLFGGQSDPQPFRDDLWRLDVRTGAWSELRPARRPGARNRYAAARAGGHWLVHGGFGRRGELGDLWRLDLARGTFARLRPRGAKPSARGGHAAAPAGGGAIVVFGGSAGGRELGDAWLLRPR